MNRTGWLHVVTGTTLTTGPKGLQCDSKVKCANSKVKTNLAKQTGNTVSQVYLCQILCPNPIQSLPFYLIHAVFPTFWQNPKQ